MRSTYINNAPETTARSAPAVIACTDFVVVVTGGSVEGAVVVAVEVQVEYHAKDSATLQARQSEELESNTHVTKHSEPVLLK